MKSLKRIFLRIFSVLLVIAMLASISACSSVDVEDNDGANQDADVAETDPVETEAVETAKVVIFSARGVRGNLLNEHRLELADVPVSDLPIDPISNLDDAMGKYLLWESVDKGMCVSESMLSDADPLVSVNGLGAGYVLYTSEANKYTDIKDTAELIQKVVDENPGKTIFFPDGRYELSKTVVIPSEEGKSVSLRLSNYAYFCRKNNWNTESTAFIQYGAADSPKTQASDHSDYIMGGIFDCDNSITAIEINGGGRLFVNNVSIKDARIGIHCKPNAAYNDIENVNVTCRNSNNSKGIFVEGTNNTFAHMRIYHAVIGAHLTGGGNTLLNLHPLSAQSNGYSYVGFWDESTGNRYSVCYSDQYPVGFKISSQTRSYFDTCHAYWWAACTYQIGFMCTGEFNSVITDTIINMKNKNKNERSQTHYLFFLGDENQQEENENENENGGSNHPNGKPGSSQSSQSSSALPSGTAAGNGVIVNPQITYPNNSDSDTYKQFTYSPN